MKNNPVSWFEIYVDDINRAKKFYESVFNVKLQKLENPNHEMWAFPGDMTTTGCAGTIIKVKGFKAGNNGIIVYFSCDDCSNEERNVEKFGGNVFKPKFSIGQFGFASLVYDTEGNMFGLHSSK